MALDILYEDNHCLVVNKPAPLLTQAPPGVPSLESLAKNYLRERYHKKGNVYLGVPHRLDRAVSGVIVLARTTKAAQRLSEQFARREVAKTYWGAVEGRPEPPEGEWEDWLRKIPDEPRAEIVPPEAPGAQSARLQYRSVDAAAQAALLELTPHTGRMHQIRVQAARHGCPIIGDALYGATSFFGPPALLDRERRIALHARQLTFLHPIRYEAITVTAPLPATWAELPFPGKA